MVATSLRRGEPLRETLEALLAGRRYEDAYDLLTAQGTGDAVLEQCADALEARLLGKYMRAARPHAVGRVIAAPDDIAWLMIDDEDRELVAHVDGTSTFETLARSSAYGRFAGYRSLYRLVKARVVVAAVPRDDRTALLPAPAPQPAVAAAPPATWDVTLVALAIALAVVAVLVIYR